MSEGKLKIIGYVTPQEKELIQARAKKLGMPIGAYFHEIAMWDARNNLLPQLRKGGTITCNGKEKA